MIDFGKIAMAATVGIFVVLFMVGVSLAQEEGPEPFFEHLEIAPDQEGLQAYTCLAKLADGTLITPYAIQNQTTWVVKSSDSGKTWSEPQRIFTNPDGGYACDPNSFVLGDTVGIFPTRVPPPYPPYTRTETWGIFSEDGGNTWGEPVHVVTPHKYLVGTIHRMIVLDDDTILMPASYESNAEKGAAVGTEGTMHLYSGVLISSDKGQTWRDQGPFVAGSPPHSGGTDGMDEPAIVKFANGELFMVARTGDSHPWEARSTDDGKTWSEPVASPLIGRNAPTAMAVLKNGWVVRVWDNSASARAPLCATISKDNGHTWSRPRAITSGYGAYPSVIQADDGTIVATYNAPVAGRAERLRVHVARFNTEWVLAAENMPIVAFVGGSMTCAVRKNVPGSATFTARLRQLAEERGEAVLFENYGIPSDTTRSGLKRLDDILADEPAVVVLEYGHCDSWMDAGATHNQPRVPRDEFEQNLRAMVQKIRVAGALPVLMTGNRVTREGVALTSWYEGRKPNESLDRYYDVVRSVAADMDVPLADVAAQWAQLENVDEYMTDGQHANVKGQQIYLYTLVEVLSALR